MAIADGEDPWIHAGDPWSQFELPQDQSASASGAASTARPGGGGSYAQIDSQSEQQQPYKVINDVPPGWDGKDLDNNIEPYLKLLHGWLSTTRTLKTQRGMTLLTYAMVF